MMMCSIFLAACSNELKADHETEEVIPITEEESEPVDEIEKIEKPIVIPIEEFDHNTLSENELPIYEIDGNVRIAEANLINNPLLDFSIKLPEGFSFYEKDNDYEKLVQSREYEQQYGFSINYNDSDRHFILLEYGEDNKALGEVAYLSNENTSIAIQDLTDTQYQGDLIDAKKYVPGYRHIDEQHGNANEVFLGDIMLSVGEGQLEVISKGYELHPFIHKLSFLAKATNQKNHDTFYIGILEHGNKVYNISIRSNSLDTGIDDLAEVWAVLHTLMPNDSSMNKDISHIIEDIREEFNQINHHIESYKLIEKNEGTSFFIDDNVISKPLRKAIEKISGETYEYYYLTNKELFFAFFVDHAGNEHRFYFHEGQLVRWIQPDQTVIDRHKSYGNREYHEWESILFQFAEQHKAF